MSQVGFVLLPERVLALPGQVSVVGVVSLCCLRVGLATRAGTDPETEGTLMVGLTWHLSSRCLGTLSSSFHVLSHYVLPGGGPGGHRSLSVHRWKDGSALAPSHRPLRDAPLFQKGGVSPGAVVELYSAHRFQRPQCGTLCVFAFVWSGSTERERDSDGASGRAS